MARRIFSVALAVCLSGWAVSAQQGRATFVLTDGERVSGVLSPRDAVRGNQLNLVIPGQRDQIFRTDEVAVIDFGGGSPRGNELSGLPPGRQMIAMRNGTTLVGYFVNILRGDLVRWQDQRGVTRDIPVRDVARIYLDPRSARNAYSNPGYNSRYGAGYSSGYNPRSNPGDNPGYNSGYNPGYDPRSNRGYDSGSSDQYGRSRQPSLVSPNNSNILANAIDVPAQRPWTDSGIDVMRGDTLRFDAQGQVAFIHGANSTAGPAGGAPKNPRYPVQTAGVGALIAKVGNNGAPFIVGDNRNAVTMPATGRLFLGINDDDFNDNSGSFSVTVMRGQ